MAEQLLELSCLIPQDVLRCLPGNSRTKGEHLCPMETQFHPPSHVQTSEQPGEVNKGAASLPFLLPEWAPKQFPDEAIVALCIPAPSFLLSFVIFWVNTEQNLIFNLSVPLWQLLEALKPKLRRFRHGEEGGIKKADVAELLSGLRNCVPDQRAAQGRAGQHPVPTMGSPSLAGRAGEGVGDICGIPSPQGRPVPPLAAPDPPVYGPCKGVYSVP